jgi:hypothetical protein
MRQGQQADLGLAGQLGHLERRRVSSLGGPFPLLVEERRFVDEHLRPARRLEHQRGRRGVAAQHDSAAGARRAEHLVRGDDAAVRELYGLARL